ncbi:uncharacterized protein LOC107981818 [Nasonia vitripennis]|uniref:Uncharacterized protein n=1 Tax=Nasonia vitripennis TaxID=7425 RepID=A0A7M7IU93_NASVI|nr:uncharacterized protein LOC107981818 [Nasonia vitripennis]
MLTTFFSLFISDKIYLGENVSIDKTVWDYLQIEKPSYFLTTVAKHLWGGPVQLMNGAMDLRNGAKNIPNRSPVKLIEHNLLRLLISLYWDFLKGNKSFTSKKRSTHLNKAVDHLRYHIRNLRSAAIKQRMAGNRKTARINNDRKSTIQLS